MLVGTSIKNTPGAPLELVGGLLAAFGIYALFNRRAVYRFLARPWSDGRSEGSAPRVFVLGLLLASALGVVLFVAGIAKT